MFGKKVNKIDTRIETLVSADTVIKGDITFAGGLRIDGIVKGNVQEQEGTEGTIIVGESGRIEGSVTATKIVLIGAVIGPVFAKEFIELQTKASIKGDLHYKSLEMHMGAVIDGKLVHTENNEPEMSI
ncbi:MAG TPA: polymer-forming cytoskeletal protein [Methylophilaceae bacterium]|nr:polymer-forming cytoskeletal protein [Methylophilaceae bacterium]